MLGEFDLIALLRERIAAAGAIVGDHVIVGSGDDAAVVEPRGTAVTSVDALVEGVHFKRSTFPPDAIGHKALTVALSDLAAMGAQPGEAYVQLGVPEDITEDELTGIADGLGSVANEYSVSVAGGDVVASPVLFLAITVVGYLREETEHVTRAGAQAGDVLVLTGPVGGAAAGLLLLEDEGLATGLDPARREALRERQLRPQALIGAGLALARSGATGDDRRLGRDRRGRGPHRGGQRRALRSRARRGLRGAVASRRSPRRRARMRSRSRAAGRTTSCSPPCRRSGWKKRSKPFAEPPATRHWWAGSRLGRVWSCAALQAAKFRVAGSTRFAHELVASPLDHRQLANDLLRDQRRVNGVGVLRDFSLELGHGRILVRGCLFFVGQ